MKLGMTSLTLRQHSVKEVVQFAARAGLDGIEWGVSDRHVILGDKARADEIQWISQENGIAVFSLGSYCYMTEREACNQALETASLLSAPVIRIWAGKMGSRESTEENYHLIVENTRYMAEQAAKSNIKLGFEYHENSLTDRAESAVSLIRDINRENVGLYWQPDCSLPCAENLENLKTVLPHLCGNLHVHNYTHAAGYQPLAAMEEHLRTYYSDIKTKDWNVMIEFVKDGSVESLLADAATLRSILGS